MKEKNPDQYSNLFPDWFFLKITKIPEGISKARYQDRIYIVSKSTFNDGNSFKLYAEEAGGNDYVSLNLYKTSETVHVKPCEQPISKSLNFLRDAEFLE